MPTNFLGLTDVSAVRSAIGIDSTDIKDELIVNAEFEDDLQDDLLSWLSTYQTIVAEGVGASPTVEQQRKYLKLKLYAKYFVATRVVTGSINSILQKQSDGANEAIRFTNVDLDQLKESLSGYAEQYKRELVEMVDPTDTGLITSLLSVVPPNYDPVTNE